MRVDYRSKKIKNLVENYNELDEGGQQEVLDKIKYQGVLEAVASVTKTQTKTFGDLYEQAEERQQFFNKFEGFGCGLDYFDEATMGFRSGEITIVAGASNLGKTVVSLNIIASTVANSLKKALVISLEMTAEEIASRVYNISDSDDHQTLMDNVIIQTDLKVGADNIHQIIEKENPDIIMVDMLQKLADKEHGSEYERISAAMSKLKSIALKTLKPMIVVSHVAKTRSGEHGKASANDLKGASNIEQDADIGIILNKQDRTSDELVVTCFKHRTKRPNVFHLDCVIRTEGIKIADNGRYRVEE